MTVLPLSPYERALRRLLSVPSSPRLGLERMESLLAALGNPHHEFEALHVAGTNGKGSTIAFAAALCARAGVRVGITTSPHLVAATERIVIDGAPISRERFVALEQKIEVAVGNLDDKPTFYERMVAMAFAAFAEANVNLALVEVGLGGRLDATNVVRPRACAITRIGLDHTQFLGETLREIAGEKAGIIKPMVPVVVAPQTPEAMKEIQRIAQLKEAPLKKAAPAEGVLALSGPHQSENAGVAVALVRQAGLALADSDIEQALQSAAWPGRFEVFAATKDRPTIVLDGAHNPDAAEALARTLATDSRTAEHAWHLIVGATRGHDPESFRAGFSLGAGPQLGQLATVVATKARAPRSVAAEDVASAWARPKADVVSISEIERSVERWAGTEGAVVVVTGSLYLVGEIRALLVDVEEDPLLPDF